MTDNEIIEALKCCKKDGFHPRCRKCPLSQYADCQTRLEREIFPLVNRQRAEIEDLKETLSIFRETLSILREDMHLIVERRRHEAIKEFAERFKELCGNDVSSAIVWAKGTIDNLVKEMVGEDK